MHTAANFGNSASLICVSPWTTIQLNKLKKHPKLPCTFISDLECQLLSRPPSYEADILRNDTNRKPYQVRDCLCRTLARWTFQYIIFNQLDHKALNQLAVVYNFW